MHKKLGPLSKFSFFGFPKCSKSLEVLLLVWLQLFYKCKILYYFLEKTPLRDNAKIKVANLKDELKSKEVEQNKIKSQCENEEKILKGLHTDIDEIKTKINMNQKTIQNMKEEQHNKTSNRQNNIGYTVEVS